jgi:glycosyltransferase involved in cell wall biosynthesis
MIASRLNPEIFLMTNSFETGGSERQFAALARSLQSSQFHTQIGCIAKRGHCLAGFDNILEFPLGGNLYGTRSILARLRLCQHLRKSRIGIAHAFDFYTNLVLVPAARLAGVPVVIGSQRQLGDLLSPAKSRAQVAALRWCDRVVCNSRAAATLLAAQGISQSRIVVIGNGLAPSFFASVPPTLDRSSSILRVGMIARMNASSKNHGLFLRAAARVSDRFPDVEFVLAGDGPLRPSLEREAQDLGLGNRVRFLGDRSDITAVLRSIDVSVLPSSSESLSNAILESMAAGVPVVATQVGGNPELVAHDRGILVAPGDQEALANGIVSLLQNSVMRSELGRNGRKFAESNFTIDIMRRRHEELYAELLERKTRGRKLRRSKIADPARDRPLRVAVVAASARYVGGQSVQAESLVANWRNDPDIEAFLIPIDPSLPRGLKWAESIPFFRTLVRQPFYLAAIWRGLNHADIAHIFSASYWSFLVAPAPAWMLARIMGKKTIIHYHSGEARDHLQQFRSARLVLAKAGRLVVPSNHLVGVFHEFGVSAQVVPNVVDLSQFAFRERKPLRPHLLCTRGFHPYYRVDLVIRAFAELQRVFPEARLDLVGKGSDEARIRRLAQELNLTGINFAGVASRHEISRFYDAADIFINASVLDNMPVSILEAFAAGTPVVSTAPEGMRYLVDHGRTGLLSEPGDASALTANVVWLLRDPTLAANIAANARQQSRRYCWSAVRGQWLEIYQSLAPGSVRATQGLISVAGESRL